MNSAPIVVILTPATRPLAERILAAVPGATIEELKSGAKQRLGDLFAAGTPIIGICATGILVRAVAAHLGDKRAEPPVVAVAADGSAVVPVLGGHRGANRLARSLAKALGGKAAVTTAGDALFDLALDDPPPGWRVANPEAAKAVMAAMIDGQPLGLTAEAGEAAWLTAGGARFAEDARPRVVVTDREASASDDLVLHPPVLALGVGCERGCDPAEAVDLARRTLAAQNLSSLAVACVVSLDLKADEPAVQAVAEALGVPARFFDAARLEAETSRLANPSPAVFKAVGCHGVAEGAALAAVGGTGSLVVPKMGTRRATCAVARAARALDVATIGRARGRLLLVGIGPGTPAWRSPAATAALCAASDWVGYRPYLDLAADLAAGKILHDSPMTQEEARARQALELAAEGKTVALIGSGDIGIYALATLAYELIDRENRPEWNRLAVSVVPGISAAQAAASRAGAPLGHDFCFISLSDLLTPWPDIERRLKAAAEGDFVVALYNPVSKKRRTQIEQARDILLAHRDAATPVVLARNLGRPDETRRFTTLGELSAEDADMLTVVLIGSTNTRRLRRGEIDIVYTPRGYEAKRQRGKQRP